MAEKSGPNVEREIRVAARPEIVFRYFTDPERMGRWLGRVGALDARPGGALAVVVAGTHGAGGQFVEIDPPRRVVFTWGWDEPGHPIPPGSTRIEVSLTADGDDTVLRLRHLGLPADAVEEHTFGWTHYLDRLAVAGAGGDPGPDPMAAAGDMTATTASA